MSNVTSPPSASRKAWNWFHDRLTWPLVAATVFAAITFGITKVPPMDGCGNQAKPVVEKGESAFFRGRIDDADTYAAEALTLAPDCECGHILAGRVRHAQMLIALRAGDPARAKAMMLDCLSHLVRAKTHSDDPEVAALTKACSTAAAIEG